MQLNLLPSGVMPVLYLNQYDYGMLKTFEVYNGAELFAIPTGYSVTLRATKPDGYGITVAGSYTAGQHIVFVTIPQQLTAAAGDVIAELVLANANSVRVGTINFVIRIEPAALSDNTVISDSDIAYAEEVLDQLQSVQSLGNQVSQNTAAISAEASTRAAAVSSLQAADTALSSSLTAETSARQAGDTALSNQIAALQGAVGAPQVAATAAAMTDTSKIYVYTGSETGYTAGNWYYYNGSSWVSGGVYNAVAVNTDPTLSVAGMAADAKATGDQVTDLKSQLNMIETPQIVGMTDTGVSTISPNLFKYATMIGYHKIIYSLSGGKVVLTDATSSNTYLIPVDGVSTYTFTFCRSAVVVSDTDLTAVGSILNNVQSVNSTGGKYIVFSFNTTTYPESSYEVTKPINKYKIPKDWDFGDVKIHTPQINGMLPTGKTVRSSNLFPSATLIYTGKYVDRIVDGQAYFSDSTNLDTYLLPVDGSTTYSFTNCRTALLVSDLEYTAVGTVLSYVTEINTTGAAYVLFSFNRNTYPSTSYAVTHPVAQYTIPADWDLQSDHKNQYQINSGSIADGGSLALTGKTAVKFGQRIVFKGVITSFSQIKLAFYNYNNSSVINSIIVDSTNIYVYSGTTAVQTWVHGLTIMHDISLIVDYLKDNVQISLESNGTIYKNTATWGNLTSGVVSVSAVSTGTVCSSAILLMAISEALKPIWYFGDSYISHTNQARWTYYLLDYGFDKGTLLNGYAGGTSATSVMALTALLGYGTPKFAVFATGMNDGSDSDSAPSASWVNARDNFISICESNSIEMIFATVPTVPSVNNEQKNAWVRSSGYRYIDFAKAVGADGTGAWYSGMLSADNVHPTEKGAIALFTQVLIDLPEVTV